MRTFFAAACLLAVTVSAAPAAEKVAYLPGMGKFDKYGLYSGYINLNDKAGAPTSKKIHYLFVEAQTNAATAPVMIWTNGGPGCSSMLGFTQENGPFHIPSGTTDPTGFLPNAQSWNKEMNVLYIDQPAGVGFSQCTGVKDCTFNDETSGNDNLQTILGFYEKYPEYKKNDLWISGESYGGIYVPYMAYNIDQHNTAHREDDTVFKPLLKGFAVGNGVTNWKYDTTPAFVDMGYWHSLYDTSLKEKIDAAKCDFSGPYGQNTTAECATYLDEFNGYVKDVNVYDIFGTCYGVGDHPQLYGANGPKKLDRSNSWSPADYTPWLQTQKKGGANELPPCTWGSPLITYLNSKDVRDALHIPTDFKQWNLCTQDIHYVIQPKGSQWIYEALKGKYAMLHYSGDVDGAVPTIGTQNWIANMNWDVDQKWKMYEVNSQVAGYTESYKGGLTFGTVHGAGHMAPQFKPEETYHLVFNFIFGRPI